MRSPAAVPPPVCGRLGRASGRSLYCPHVDPSGPRVPTMHRYGRLSASDPCLASVAGAHRASRHHGTYSDHP